MTRIVVKKYNISKSSRKQKWTKSSFVVSFKVRGIFKNTKIQAKLFHYEHSKLCTFSKSVYNFILRHSLARRAFPKAKYSVFCREFPMASKFHFS